MSQRRDFLGYIGTGALGAMAGYYVGAQELLGIQSSATGRPDDDSDRGSDNNVGGATETEETNQNQNTSQADIFDDFEDTSQLK